MNFLKWDLGNLRAGDVLRITLTRAANVRLMTPSNFSSFRRGSRHHYQGGLVKTSPFHLTIPSGGTWHLVVDMAGLAGTTEASVEVVPRPLPPAIQPDYLLLTYFSRRICGLPSPASFSASAQASTMSGLPHR